MAQDNPKTADLDFADLLKPAWTMENSMSTLAVAGQALGVGCSCRHFPGLSLMREEEVQGKAEEPRWLVAPSGCSPHGEKGCMLSALARASVAEAAVM